MFRAQLHRLCSAPRPSLPAGRVLSIDAEGDLSDLVEGPPD
jgi:hypothetical protein